MYVIYIWITYIIYLMNVKSEHLLSDRSEYSLVNLSIIGLAPSTFSKLFSFFVSSIAGGGFCLKSPLNTVFFSFAVSCVVVFVYRLVQRLLIFFILVRCSLVQLKVEPNI